MHHSQIDETPVSFPDWSQVLDADSSLESSTRNLHRQAIIGYLAHLKKTQQRASLATATAYFEAARETGNDDEPSRESLRWFFRTARARQSRITVQSPPPVEEAAPKICPEQADNGSVPWERELIKRLRVGHYQWRTEQSYREWIWRFSAWMDPRPVEDATDGDGLADPAWFVPAIGRWRILESSHGYAERFPSPRFGGLTDLPTATPVW